MMQNVGLAGFSSLYLGFLQPETDDLAYLAKTSDDVLQELELLDVAGLIDASYRIHGKLLRYSKDVAALMLVSSDLYSSIISPLENWKIQYGDYTNCKDWPPALEYYSSPTAIQQQPEQSPVSVATELPRQSRVSFSPPDSGPREERVEIVHGIVHEFGREDAVVILATDEAEERRTMSRKLLKDAGIFHEGQPFEIRVCEYQTQQGMRRVTDINRTGDPSTWMLEDVRPGLDIEKFKPRE